MGPQRRKGGANRFGLHRSLCGSAADRARRPPFRAFSIKIIRRGCGAKPHTQNQVSKLPHLPLAQKSWALEYREWKGVRQLFHAPTGRNTPCTRKHARDVPSTTDDASRKTEEAQGMGTVVRPSGQNGEVPRPLRPFVSSWKLSPDSIGFSACRFAHKREYGKMGALW